MDEDQELDTPPPTYSTSDSYSLVRHLDEHITRPIFRGEGAGHFWPSEASVMIYGNGTREVLGHCLRASYFRATGEPGSARKDSYLEWSAHHGKALEALLIDKFKEMGIWVADHVKFYNEAYNVSGELDVILSEPPDGTLSCTEVKSFYSYFATKHIVGNRWQKGRPKDNHLLQLLFYLFHFRGRINHGRLLYFARDSNKHAEFKVWIQEEDEGILRGVVDGVPIKGFTINDMLERYKLLGASIRAQQPPPNDYELVWTKERVETEKKRGDLSDKAYKEWQTGKRPLGAWQCKNCEWRRCCWPQP